MNKLLKNILFNFGLFFAFFFSILQVKANNINEIDMDIYIDASGNAVVTEKWDAYLETGTEGYRSFSNLENSSIEDFTVSDDSLKTYESLDVWNVYSSFAEKAYKSGINNDGSNIELCWGISNYGNRTYYLKYKITNLVTQYTDAQGIYFNFLNLDQKIGKANIKIHSDIPFTQDNAKIWAFGYKGKDVFEDGNIVLKTNNSLSDDEYMVGLIKFNDNLFNTSNKSTKSFDEVYNSAFLSVKKENKEKKFISIAIFSLLINFFSYAVVIFSIVTVLYFIFKKTKKTSFYVNRPKEYDFGIEGNTIFDDDKINYCRDIPCNKDLEKAYWVCYHYNIISESTLRQGIIGAILLKWIKNGYITVIKTKKGLFDAKDDNYEIDFSKMTGANNEIENDLYKILIKAAGQNKILESKEFIKWCKKKYYFVDSWFSNILKKEETYLKNEGLITVTLEKGSDMSNSMYEVKHVDSKLREEAINLKGLKKFLLDFSIMPKREYIEVHVWEEYLIFAHLLGIADKVEEQFSQLYPDFKQKTLFSNDTNTILIRNMAITCNEIVKDCIKKEEMKRESSSSDSSSGSGGSSYSSGGSSAGGSSGGGFR